MLQLIWHVVCYDFDASDTNGRMTGSGLELIALTKAYGSTVGVDRLDLKVSANSYCCLLGPSGCGKTSTLRLVAGHEVASSGFFINDGATAAVFPLAGA